MRRHGIVALLATAVLTAVLTAASGAVGADQGAAPASVFEKGHLAVGEQKKAWLPNLAVLDDGAILCAYASASGRVLDRIQAVRTDDAGKTWSQPVNVMEAPAGGYIADPNILVLGKRATVFATFVPDTKPALSRSETWSSVSEDGGRTWGPRVRIPLARRYTSGKVHGPVTLADGTIAMGYSWDVPAEKGKPAGEEHRMFARAGVLRSKDRGATWTPGGDIAINEPMGADEPALVVLRNGDLFAVVRTGGPRPYEVRSTDGGQSWSEPKPSRFVGHNSPSALLRLRDGAILRVWDHSDKNRFPLVAAVSVDECNTWTAPRTITEPAVDERGHRSFQTAAYPSIAQARDGTVLVVWWETGAFGSRIGFARFSRVWLDQAGGRAPPTLVTSGGSTRVSTSSAAPPGR